MDKKVIVYIVVIFFLIEISPVIALETENTDQTSFDNSHQSISTIKKRVYTFLSPEVESAGHVKYPAELNFKIFKILFASYPNSGSTTVKGLFRTKTFDEPHDILMVGFKGTTSWDPPCSSFLTRMCHSMDIVFIVEYFSHNRL